MSAPGGEQAGNASGSESNQTHSQGGGTSASTLLYPNVQQLVQTKCQICHAPFANYSESDWIASGLVVPGAPNGSTLYSSLQGAGVAGGLNSMPKGGSLSAAELGQIKDWISALSSASVPEVNPSTQRWLQAQAVIVGQCAGCHASFGSHTELDWIATGHVKPGQPNSSTLYSVVKGAGVGASESMPLNSTMSAQDLASIQNWIQNLDPSKSTGSVSTPKEQRWLKAQFVLQTSCVYCHASADAPHFDGTVENVFISSNGIVRSLGSKIRNQVGAQDMPPSQSAVGALSVEDRNAILDWIDKASLP